MFLDRPEARWEDATSIDRSRVELVFDVGANIGGLTQELLGAFPHADIFCFEPVLSTFAALQTNLSNSPRAHCFPFGFSESAHVRSVHRQYENTWNSIPKNIDRGLGSEEIRLETIDGFCRARDIAHVNLIKSDTEGHDLAVLKGASRMLSEGRIDAVFVEVGFYRRDVGHTYFCDVLEFLEAHHFQFAGLYQQDTLRYVQHEDEPCFPWSNALFVQDSQVQARFGADHARWLEQLRGR